MTLIVTERKNREWREVLLGERGELICRFDGIEKEYL